MRGAGIAVVILLGLAPAAKAGDGRREINQACAVAGGCFSGDAPGFPVLITESGSYILTGNLSVADPTVHAISISGAIDVQLDLKGFEIAGPVPCSGTGTGLTCGAGSGLGISASGSSVSLRNGRIGGFAAGGVQLGPGRVVNVAAIGNGGTGIQTGDGSVVRGCTGNLNAGAGIQVGATSVVERSTAASNRMQGIVASYSVTLTGNSATGNGGDGIVTSFGALVRDNAAWINSQAGIAVAAGSTVSDNSTFDNLGIGIYAENGSTVQRNTSRGNGGAGLVVFPSTTYRENTVTANLGGTVIGGGLSLGANSCNGTPSCP
jgi:Right handed beta helix region